MSSRSTVLLGASLLVEFAWNANAQTAPTMTTMLRGACSSTLNGVDTECDQKGLLTTLPNGRTMFHVTGKIVATIGFAGRLQATSASHKVLWIDAAYINQSRVEADGQCSVESAGENMTISCKAILKDGRVLTAEVTHAATETSSLPESTKAQSQGSDCETTMKTHAFLSRAQFQCGFRHYSEDMIGAARVCFPQLGESRAKELMTSGMETFDRNERERGHKALCAEILTRFPNILRR